MEIPLTTIAIIIAIYYALRYLWELIPVGGLHEKVVFISGCDSGFGRALALKCARAGMTVFAGCLTKLGEQSLQKESPGLPLKTVPLDVTSDESVLKAREFVEANLKGKKLWAVVNNAGIFTCYGPDDWCSIDDHRLSLEVNTLGVVRCTQAFMDVIKENEGRIVSVSSVAGRIALAGGAPYAAAKYAVEGYMDVIRQETHYYNVKVSILEPGIFKSTSLLDKEAMNRRVDQVYSKLPQKRKDLWGDEFKEFFKHKWNTTLHAMGSTHTEYVVDNYFHAITARFPRDRYACGWDAIFIYIPMSFAPSIVQDTIMRIIAKRECLPNYLKKKLKQN